MEETKSGEECLVQEEYVQEEEPIAESLFGALLQSIRSKVFGEKTTLSWIMSTLIMVSLSYGSAVVILPYTMSQLGIVSWNIFTLAIFFVLAFCTVLLKQCCVHIMDIVEDYAMLRHPYAKLAEIAVNKRFSHLVLATLYVTLVSETLAFILLSATVLNNIIPIAMSYYTTIRIWVVVCFVVSFPFMLFGSYNDMKFHAVIAVVTSFIAMICIFATSLLIWYKYGFANNNAFKDKPKQTHKHFLLLFGDITFAAAGPALALPNIIVLMESPKKFHYSIVTSHIIVALIYVLCACIPYAVFQDDVTSAITVTLTFYIHALGSPRLLHGLLVVCQICITSHFIMVSALSMNPVFLSLENTLNIPFEFTYKRVLLRGSFLVCMLGICLVVPYFSPILSMVGAVPVTALAVIFPIIIYMKLFRCHPVCLVFLILLVLAALFFMVGNIVVSIIDLLRLYQLL